MKTDIISVSSTGDGATTALAHAEAACAYANLDKKKTLQIRLLTEEMMGMLQGMTGETDGEFWIEAQGKNFRLNLKTNTNMNSEKRKKILSSSHSGKNVEAKGFMGKMRDILERMLEPYDDTVTDAYASGFSYPGVDASLSMPSTPMWSYNQYRDSLNDPNHSNREVWDELEKSIVGSLADDIQIGIKGDSVRMTIFKNFED